jgi:DNA-directed RNA polymerase specialized sigma subunit
MTAEPTAKVDPSPAHAGAAASSREEETRAITEQVSTAVGDRRDALLHRLVDINTPVAEALVYRYAGRGIGVSDLELIANRALVVAADQFDTCRDDDFWPYAAPTIRDQLRSAFRDLGWPGAEGGTSREA